MQSLVLVLRCVINAAMTGIADLPPDALVLPEYCINIRTDDCYTKYVLRGLIYYGNDHFVSRYIDKASGLWFHDGADTGTSCIFDGGSNVTLEQRAGKKVCMLLYHKESANEP